MPAAETVLDTIGTLLNLGGTLNAGAKSRAASDAAARAARGQGDNALIVSAHNADALRKAGDNARTVAEFNAKQFELRAEQLRRQSDEIARQGVTQENDLRTGTAQLIGAQRATYAAGNVIVDRGTPAAMQISTARQGEVDALRIRDNTISLLDDNAFEQKQALGQADILRMEGEFSAQAANNTADVMELEGRLNQQAAYNTASAYESEGENTEEASWLNAAGGLLTSPVASKWLTDLIRGGGGTGGGGGTPGTPGTPGAPATGWAKWVPTATEVAAGAVGGYLGQQFGEKMTGNEATANWGATIGGYAGSLIGPWGAAIGAAIGGFIDSAFGASYSHNAGFLIHDVPGAPANRKFEVEPFASGIQPVGFVRRTSKADAEAVIEPFRALDKLVVDTAAEFGYTVTGAKVRGTDEQGNPDADGVFIGSAHEAGKKGKSVADHMKQFGVQLIQSLEGQVSPEAIDEIIAAGDTEQQIIKMREVLAREAA